MTRKKKFSECFWATDMCSTAGFEVIAKYMKEGHKTCMAFVDFLRKRSKLEDEYHKALKNSCKDLGKDLEQHGGVFVESLKEKTEKIADEHSRASKEYSDAATRLDTYMKKQLSERKSLAATVKDDAKKKIALHHRNTDAKKTYHVKAKDFETCDNDWKKAKDLTNAPLKEMEKKQQQQQKSRDEMLKAESTYREVHKNLEEARDQWQRDMTRYCELCDGQEEARLTAFQNEMWIYSNVISLTCVVDDKVCEDMRQMLEKFDIDDNIMEFISKTEIGSTRPAPVNYEQYVSQFGRRA